MNSYWLNIAIALDQLGNAIIRRKGKGGAPDETISSRAGRTLSEDPLAEKLCRVLDVIDPNHCIDSIEFTVKGDPDPHHIYVEGRK